jgi:hypothetical protein
MKTKNRNMHLQQAFQTSKKYELSYVIPYDAGLKKEQPISAKVIRNRYQIMRQDINHRVQ